MQNSSVLITVILDTMNVIEKLEDLQKEEAALPFSSEKVNGGLLIRPALTNLPATKKLREANKKAKNNSAELLVHHEYKVTDVRGGKTAVSKIKNIYSGIVEAIKLRFHSFEANV